MKAADKTVTQKIGMLIGIAACALLGYVIFATKGASVEQPKSVSDAKVGQKQVDPSPSPPVVITPNSEPLEQKFSGLEVTAWQILKNPFIYKGKLVSLDFESIPIISDESLVQYVRQSPGRFGVRFNRMIAANRALYDITGINARDASSLEQLGQLIIRLDHDGDALSVTRKWLVITEDPSEATNQLGAAITVPTVRFVRYADQP